jgi:hypothetical protein
VPFTAAANGSPVPKVQWQVLLAGRSTFSNVPGATLPTLTFSAQSSENGAEYRAVFTNPVGQATSDPVTLTVDNAPPVVTTQPVGHTVAVGGTATFTVAANGNPGPAVQWQVKAVGARSFTNISGQTLSTLTLSPVAQAESGNLYRAVFNSTLGTAISKAAILTVDAPPTITMQPENETVHAGQTAAFTAAASGTSPKVQWQVSTDGGKTFTNLSGDTSATLRFAATAGKNGYHYRAVFTNPVGQDTTNDAVLVVS